MYLVYGLNTLYCAYFILIRYRVNKKIVEILQKQSQLLNYNIMRIM